jgi:hypothetical protein
MVPRWKISLRQSPLRIQLSVSGLPRGSSWSPRKASRGGWNDPDCAHPSHLPNPATPRHAISPGEGLSILFTSVKGVAKAALYCAHRTSTVSPCAFCEQEGHLAAPSPSLQARSLFLQGWGLIDLPLRASNEGLLRPRVARAQKINRPPSPSFQALLPTSLGDSLVDPLLRASNEHLPSVRVPRAGG